MRLDWLTWSNPVAVWWSFLVLISAANIALLLGLRSRFRGARIERRVRAFAIEPLLLLSAAYVFGCAFRSVLPRADVQRICLFDTWLSSILVGRAVATVAEICFAVQWAIVLREFAKAANSDTAQNIANAIVHVIVVAEACCWYAVVTTNFWAMCWKIRFGRQPSCWSRWPCCACCPSSAASFNSRSWPR